MKIEFELNEIQGKALESLKPIMQPQFKAMTESELAKKVFVDFIIQNKQKLVAQELQ